MSHFRQRPYGYVKVSERGYKRGEKFYECSEVRVFAALPDGTRKSTTFGVKLHGLDKAMDLARERLEEWTA